MNKNTVFARLPNQPKAQERLHETAWHGATLGDDYHWLRAHNWQEAMRQPDLLPDEIKDYLIAENEYYDAAMSGTADLQQALIEEMRGRIKEDDSSIPVKDGAFAYVWKYDEGQEHPVRIRTPREGGKEEIIIDINKEAEVHGYFQIGYVGEDPTHEMLAWSADTTGSEYYNLKFRPVGSDADTDTEIADVGSVAWIDAETLLYTKVDEHHRPSKVYRHKLNADPADDELVYEEPDQRFYCSVSRSRSGKYVFISTGMNDQDEIYYVPTNDLSAAPQLIQGRMEGLEYAVEHQGDRFLILTNAGNAEDFKIVETPVTTPGMAHWKDLIAHQQGRMLLSVDAYQDWIIWLERENALPRICYMAADGERKEISFAEEAYGLGIAPSPEFDAGFLRFTYSSPTTPSQIYEFDLGDRSRELLKETEIPSGHDRDDYVTRRLMAPSHDGAEVPVTLLYHRDTAIDGSAPCLLYGYGAYGATMPAGFSSNRLSLVDRGFVYAIAHVRGGQEKGRRWYENAKLQHKTNSFQDFIAVGNNLCEREFTAKGNIIAMGGSAGGLLVGACVNMAPDLFAGVIADVPFVDVLNTMLDETLPLTPGEWSQWGNPIEEKEAFDWIRAYSPYDNVEAKDYPAMLVTAGVSDPRVTYWEPAKWVAKLRELKTDDNILLLRTNMTSGHFGKTGRFAALEDAARSYAFALKVTGRD